MLPRVASADHSVVQLSVKPRSARISAAALRARPGSPCMRNSTACTGAKLVERTARARQAVAAWMVRQWMSMSSAGSGRPNRNP